ncbi:Zinc/iron permease [Spinellus fusiger]|nr:Zinc/iron permease [Spinellus fusiger]
MSLGITSSTRDDFSDEWFAVFISSAACIMGASVVFVDTLWSKPGTSVLKNPTFLAISMSLASGVLMFSSLYTLLPAAHSRLDNDYIVYTCYFSGALLTLLLTYAIQYFAPNAIDTCGHDKGKPIDEETHISSNTPFSSPHLKNNKNNNKNHDTNYGAVHYEEIENKDRQIDAQNYFNTGIQTAAAIVVHKFPEGLIMFISGQASPELGLSVAIAISIHNVIEGFMIALPLYLATQSHKWSFGYAAVLGGLSQPIGAALGILMVRTIGQQQEDYLFGIVFGIISGMMSFIAVQSMLPQAIKADVHHRYVPLFFFVGIFIIGFASLLQSK